MIAAIIQARMTSTRLPGKVLLPLGGHSILWHVLARAKAIRGVDLVLCAVPDSPASDPIERESALLGVPVFRGPEHDVLARYHGAAKSVGADVILRITADCPLLDPGICETVLQLVLDGFDFASNGFPDGLDCEAFTMALLEDAHRRALSPYDREHVTPFMRRNASKRRGIGAPGFPDVKLSVDTAADYDRLRGAA